MRINKRSREQTGVSNAKRNDGFTGGERAIKQPPLLMETHLTGLRHQRSHTKRSTFLFYLSQTQTDEKRCYLENIVGSIWKKNM